MIDSVQEFYNRIKFPGLYTVESLEYHHPVIRNPYLALIDSVLDNGINVADIGCGTGYISNFFAKRYPESDFLAVDFADSIEHAAGIAQAVGLANIEYCKKDFRKIRIVQDYDVVICQGVLHHIPEYKYMLIKLKNMVKPRGRLVLGLYHPWGKFAKQWFDIDYRNNVLYQDQELNPFEISLSRRSVLELCSDMTLEKSYPSLLGNVAIPSLFNYKNGGLVTYVLRKN